MHGRKSSDFFAICLALFYQLFCVLQYRRFDVLGRYDGEIGSVADVPILEAKPRGFDFRVDALVIFV